jgi:DNA-binding response OmpR family regulator
MTKSAKPENKKSVLIVEDSIDFSNLLKFIVEDDGYEGVQFPVTGEDIVTAVKDLKPGVVLMDLALRRKGGLEFINDLRADPETAQVPVIVISGRDLSQRDVADLQAMGVRYLRKGRVEMHEIRREIRNSMLGKSSDDSGPKPKTASGGTSR